MNDFKLNYPLNTKVADRTEEMVGQVVGPNWLGEFFVLTDVEKVFEETGEQNHLGLTPWRGRVKASFALLTEERRGKVSAEHGRMFADRVVADKERNDRAGIEPVLEWREIADLERFVRSDVFFSAVL